jgi:uncharacterized phiE125 gp8 family phage protein
VVYPRKLQTAPTEEPLLLTEAKKQCNIDHDADDDLITSLIVTARQDIENVTSRALITQTWDMYLPCFPSCGEIRIPLGSLQSISVFEWTNTAGTTTQWTVSGTDLVYDGATKAHIDTVSEPGLIVLADGQSWPTDTLKTVNPIHIRFVCGYGLAAAVPGPIKQAMLLLIGHGYSNRDAVMLGNTGAAVDSKPLALGVESLLANYRLWA